MISDFITSPTSSRVLKILILVALLLFVAAILVFWFGSSSFSERSVEFKLEGPEHALSGDEAVYKLTIKNGTRTDLSDLHVRFSYPSNSIVIEDTDSFSSDDTAEVNIDELGSGSQEVREFRAFLVGDRGSILYAKAEMTYHAGSIQSRFEKKPVQVATTITGMPIPLTLSAPPTAVAGQEITYTLDYRNDTQGDVSDLRLQFTYPDGFTPRRFSPQPSSGTSVWNIATLKKGAGARISITGVLNGNERDAKTIIMTLQRKVGGTYIDYERAEATTVISSPLLTLSTRVNGSRDTTVSPGEQLVITLQFRNTSTYTFTGLVMMARLEGEMFDFGTISVGNAFFDDATKTVIWNASSIPNLSSLGPAQGGTAEFRIALKPNFSGGVLGSQNFFVKTTSTLITTDIPAGLDAEEISVQDSLVTKITTEPNITQVLYYNDAAFGSAGPMPPQVGQETTFTVHWQVINPGNAVSNAVVKATLPAGVTWKNVTSSASGIPAPTFDRNTSQVIWNLGTIPSGTGTFSSKYETSFQVSITPSSTQRNSSPTLLRNGILTGMDSFTQQNIVVEFSELTTGDTADRPNDGTVQ